MKITRQHLSGLIRKTLVETRQLEENEFYEKFTNELNNEIELSIEPIEGDTPDTLKITLLGPTSISENTITRVEAERLSEMLIDYLSATTEIADV
jgi:hypothetical protein